MPLARRNAAHTAVADLERRERMLRAAEELAQQGSWMWEIGSDVVTWSDQVHAIFGSDPAGPAPTYDEYLSSVHADDLERLRAAIRDAIATGGSYEIDHRIVRRDGRVREVRSTGRAEMDAQGRPILLTGGLHDVTEMRIALRELNRSRDLFAGVLDAATEQSIIATDPEGLITVFNTGAERMLGYTAEEMIGTSPERLHDAGEIRARADELRLPADFGVFLAQAATGEPETRQWTYITRDDRRLLASITVSAMRGPRGEVTGFIKVGTDITELNRSRAALQESESRFRDLFQYAPNGMMLLGVGSGDFGRFLQVNPAMSRLTGYSEQQLLSMEVSDLLAPGQPGFSPEQGSPDPGHPVSGGTVEQHWLDADGSELWVQVSLSPAADSGIASVVGQVEDITARKRAEEALRHQALHDALTGLPNRVLLLDRIEHALDASRRTDTRVGVLYIDLDGFKGVNDSAGHAAGDRALVHVAEQVRAVLRPGDSLARIGGDEFVVVCEHLHDRHDATALADRVMTALRTPFEIGGTVYALSGSIGISLADDSSTAERLVDQADQAMYVAKGSGRGRLEVGDSDAEGHLARAAQATRRMRLSAELGYAVERDELRLYGQPVLDLRSGRVVAVETLLRWVHPDLGILAPAAFLDVAEATDHLILPIGRWALRESCRMAASWVELLGSGAPVVHVNLSGRQLETGGLEDEVMHALASAQLAPTLLALELTETRLPLAADSLRRDLQRLRDRGVKVAIDDVGTGYSTLSRITELPVDILKIDRSFVGGMEANPASAAVVRGVLSIGDELGLDVIAEGVETPPQAARLTAYGCAKAQGYLYSPPLPEEELLARLR